MYKRFVLIFILSACILNMFISCQKDYYYIDTKNALVQYKAYFTKSSSPDSLDAWWNCDSTAVPIDSAVCEDIYDPGVIVDTSDHWGNDWLPDGYWDENNPEPDGGGGGYPGAGQRPPYVNENLKPADCSRYYGDSYYDMRFQDYKRRYPNNYTTDIYYLSYGNKYYSIFMSLKDCDSISEAAKQWVDRCARLLQEKMEDILKLYPSIEENPSLLRQKAFESHPSAYIEAGLFSLSMVDKIQILLSVEQQDLFSYEGLIQVSTVACQQITYYRSHEASALIDASLFVLYWNDIRQLIQSYLNQTKSSSIDVDSAIEILLGDIIDYYYENIEGFSLPGYPAGN